MNMMSGPFSSLQGVFNDLLTLSPEQIAMTNAPDFLKVAAMNEQQKIRQGNPNPPQTTVVQDIVQQEMAAAPPPMMAASGGLIGLPVSSDMYADQYYARGGVVGYAPGGEVYTSFDSLPDYVRKYVRRNEEGGFDLDPRIINPRTEEEQEARDIFQNFQQGIGTDSPAIEYGPGTNILPPNPNVPRLPEDSIDSSLPPPPPPPPPPQGVPDAQYLTPGVFDQLYKPTDPFKAPPIKELQAYAPTPEEIMDARAKANELAGYNLDESLAGRRERIAKAQEELDKFEERSPWLNLMNAGLEMAQTPGSFVQGLAAGAKKGLEEYRGDLETIRDRQDALDLRNDAIEDLRIADARGDAATIFAAEQRAKQAVVDAANTNTSAQNHRDLLESMTNYQQADSDKDRAIELYKIQANINVELQKMQATLSAANLKTIQDGTLDAKGRAEIVADLYENIDMNPEFQAILKDRDVEVGSDAYQTLKEEFVRDRASYMFNIANSVAGLNSLTGANGWDVKPQ